MSIGLLSSSELTVFVCVVAEAFGLSHPDSYHYLRHSSCVADKTINDHGTFQDVLVRRTQLALSLKRWPAHSSVHPIKGYRHIHPGITFWVHRRPKLQLLLCVFVVNRIPCERCSSRRRTSGRSCASWPGSSTRGTSSSWRPEERRSPPNQVRESFSSLHVLRTRPNA